MLDGEFLADDAGGVLSFERSLPRPIEKIWAALTIPERVADWCGGGAEIDLRIGGVFRIHWPKDLGVMNGVITALDPPRLLEYSWHEPTVSVPASKVRWTLSPDGDGCRLKLEHIFTDVDRKSVTEFAGGWHEIVNDIFLASDGLATTSTGEGHKALQAGYAEKFGVR
jgi:uncharacterized protein YndB with AHSA1/START domain